MVRVGVIGLGMMGLTHLDAYSKMDDVEIVAIADVDEDRLHGRTLATGNVEGQVQGAFDFASVKKYNDGKKLIRNKHIDLVDVCLITPLHLEFGRAVLHSGKHLMIEKPLARTYREAKKLAEASQRAAGFAMPGQCMRFWPQWVWLKQAIDDGRFGKPLAATFRRLSSHPGGAFYRNGDACGGALLDLHVHDTDFVHFCFGVPRSVSSTGYSKITNAVDHVITHYDYEDGPMVVAEGGWAMTDGFGFSLSYSANFERATAVYDMAAETPLILYEQDKAPQAIDAGEGIGYEHELAYLINCIKTHQAPSTVTLADAALSVKIAEAEAISVATGRPVKIQV